MRALAAGLALVATAGVARGLAWSQAGLAVARGGVARPRTASELAQSFEPRPFSPPWYLSNQHYQTIASAMWWRKLASEGLPPLPRRREVWMSDDGEDVVVDFVLANEDSDGMVVVLHGLESSPDAPLCQDMARGFVDKGLSVALVAFRSCVMETRTPRAYHIGFTEDVEMVCRTLRMRWPGRRLYLSGFSLGGNVALRLAGELGSAAEAQGLSGVAVTCVPMQPAASAPRMSEGFNKAVYAGNFLRTLKAKAERMHEKYPDAFDIERIRRASTLTEFDDAFIAPVFGFESAWDYYEKAASRPLLDRITVPTLVLNALDDPFIEPRSLPRPEEVPRNVRLVYTERGGHCGFIHSTEGEAPHGYLAEELSRAIALFHSPRRYAAA
mmetsp:Transcript_6526/g.22015  ORF Transcript_6526/g.22015 Transcript_6526/m.22015 type:complete len:384 (-) Transcript_6526:58-1209(-)